MQQTHESSTGLGIKNEFECDLCSYAWILDAKLCSLSRLTKIRYMHTRQLVCPNCIIQINTNLKYRKLPHNLKNTLLWAHGAARPIDFNCDDCGDNPNKSWSLSTARYSVLPMRQYLHGNQSKCYMCFANWVLQSTPWI